MCIVTERSFKVVLSSVTIYSVCFYDCWYFLLKAWLFTAVNAKKLLFLQVARLRFERSDFRFEARGRIIFFFFKTSIQPLQTTCPPVQWVRGYFSRDKAVKSVELIYLHLLTRLRITRAILLFPYTLSWRGQRQLSFFFIGSSLVFDLLMTSFII